jgi:hypothetical protein
MPSHHSPTKTEISQTIEDISLNTGDVRDQIIQLPAFILPYRQILCAYVASLFAIGVGFPLDSIKTRQQTYRYRNAWQCAVETKRNEGVKGFYRGGY